MPWWRPPLKLAVLSVNETGIPRCGLDYGDSRWGSAIDITGEECKDLSIEETSCELLAPIDPQGQEDELLQGNPVKDGEVLPNGALDDVEPDGQTLCEATGNGGASISRSYRCGARAPARRIRGFASTLYGLTTTPAKSSKSLNAAMMSSSPCPRASAAPRSS